MRSIVQTNTPYVPKIQNSADEDKAGHVRGFVEFIETSPAKSVLEKMNDKLSFGHERQLGDKIGTIFHYIVKNLERRIWFVICALRSIC